MSSLRAETSQNAARYKVVKLHTEVQYYGVVYVAPNLVQCWLYVLDKRLYDNEADTDLLECGEDQIWKLYEPWCMEINDARNALELVGTDYDSTGDAVLRDIEDAVQNRQLRAYRVPSIKGLAVSSMEE